jgi:hypothetical protein
VLMIVQEVPWIMAHPCLLIGRHTVQPSFLMYVSSKSQVNSLSQHPTMRPGRNNEGSSVGLSIRRVLKECSNRSDGTISPQCVAACACFRASVKDGGRVCVKTV